MSRSNPTDPSRLASKRDPLAEFARSTAQSRSGWTRALQVECQRHHAAEGVPCWSWEGEDGADHAGLCDHRAREAGLIRPGRFEHPGAGPRTSKGHRPLN